MTTKQMTRLRKKGLKRKTNNRRVLMIANNKDKYEVVLVPVFRTEEQEEQFARIAKEKMSLEARLI